MQNHPQNAELGVPPVDDSLNMKFLAFMLSIIAGSVDAISFLGLGGLLTAQITGNVVILVARVVAHEPVSLSYLIAVPVFMVVLGTTRLLVAALTRVGITSSVPLLALQFLLLLAFLNVSLTAGPQPDPNTPTMIFAGMLSVSAMAVQNALVRIFLADAPATAVMTTNITVFAIDVGEICLGQEADSIAKARNRRCFLSSASFSAVCSAQCASQRWA